MKYFVLKSRDLRATFEENENDIINNHLKIIEQLSKSSDITLSLELIETINKILKVYSIYEDGSHTSFIEKIKTFRNDIIYNIYNQVKDMLDQLKEKLVLAKNQNNEVELKNSVYIMKRVLIQLSERVIEPGEIITIHNSLITWLMNNFKLFVETLGYTINLALIINLTLTNLYNKNDLEKIENFFINFLANETKQENEEVDFISYWIIEKILKKNKNVNELVQHIYSLLEPNF
ncbi:hypothetical protein BCR36DRAFT_72108 [Piromyces finnis]|uniref:Uncharacterized protein n=1 Tax=Piromyces finnis TaxID=1754191 RepID=A0A1Y1V701_9FUNG|nr:hypothetical protein BCR36DRAFT_72108 [Piromyces finnis]|eukprot:ORX48625.1 hypothetical protein BCR36DRAFT_72108 [Piromyces finnis]